MKDFIIGCNYWASNAGTEMWRDFSETAIREDLEILSEHGIRYLRVFPNWRDFQPIIPVIINDGQIVDYVLEGDRRPSNPYYLDEKMMDRFSRFCEICDEYDMKLIVGLITGWMSGRSFIPAALYGKKLATDPVALLFQQRMVKGMVETFKDRHAIAAWDLGNECNCLVCASDKYSAGTWTGMIANSIRACDNSRPIVSGMHSLKADDNDAVWTVVGQAEFCDILTTHPYPFWVRHADKDKITSLRTMMHATCETKLYADLGNCPCLVEEIGSMGPMICSNEVAADFMKVNLISNWVNGASGVMWWCANEQTNLMTMPYTMNMCELELGMIDGNRKPKPVLKAVKTFSERLSQWSLTLPEAREDAVCILSGSQDQWGVAYMAYCLAKQNSFNLKFCYCKDEIPEADIYMLPSVSGHYIMPRENYLELKKRVAQGALLYVSNDNGILAEFQDLTGLKVIDSCKKDQNKTLCIGDKDIAFSRRHYFQVTPMGADILMQDSENEPVAFSHAYGQGKVIYLNFPLEAMLIQESDTFDHDHYKIYGQLFGEYLEGREAKICNEMLSMTLHPMTDGDIYCVIVNYSNELQQTNLTLKKGFNVKEVVSGNAEYVEAYDVTILLIGQEK